MIEIPKYEIICDLVVEEIRKKIPELVKHLKDKP